MQSDPLVSILIVAHNAERFICETVRSCLQQSYVNLEVLILENFSSDRTLQNIATIKDARVRVYQSATNLGAYRGLNFLLDRANGEIIAIQDHDDLWLPEKLNYQITWLREHPSAIGCGTLMYYYFAERRIATIVPRLESGSELDHPSLIFLKNLLRYNPRHPAPDEVFMSNLQSHGELSCLQIPLGIHRIHASGRNLSVQRSRLNFRGAFAHLRLSKWRDILGTLYYMFGGTLPSSLLWWLRENITMRSAVWISKKELEYKTGLQVD